MSPEGEVEMVVRVLLLLIVAVLAGGGLTACSTGPETGDCVEKSGDSYVEADCATASLRVLERLDDPSGDCIAVAGVTESYGDTGSGSTLCIGPRDVDPAAAINVAKEGDCVVGVAANADVHRVDCSDGAAEAWCCAASRTPRPSAAWTSARTCRAPAPATAGT